MNRIKELGDRFRAHLSSHSESPSPQPDRSSVKGGATRPSYLLDPNKEEPCEMSGTPTVMEDVKDWLMTKCRDASTLLTTERHVSHGGKLVNFSNIVVTPENIPPFTIPRNEGVSSSNGCDSPDSEGCSHSSDSLSHSAHTTPRHSPCSLHKNSNNFLSPQGPLRTRSAPVSPSRSIDEKCGGSLVKLLSDMDYDREITNADPFSRTALSLPHLKAKTDFGFETLSESPHTRRKESLFHDVSGAPLYRSLKRSNPRRQTTGSVDFINPQIVTERRSDISPGSKPRHNKRRNVPPVVAPLGVVLVPSSHAGEGRLLYTSNVTKLQLPPFRSCPELEVNPTAANMNSADSLDNIRTRKQISIQHYNRRSLLSEDIPHLYQDTISCNLLLTPNDNTDYLWSESSNHSSSTDLSSPHSCRSFSKCGLGMLRFSLQYLKQRCLLKVGILRAEGLRNSQNYQLEMNTFVKLCLLPGKIQKQATRTVKQTNNPVYNQEFLFHNVEPHMVSGLKLQMKVYQKSSKIGREEILGELQVNMENLELSTEMKLLKPLEPPMSKQELGYIQISACFYASAEKLTVTIHKATDLEKHTFTGAPDPYVLVELHQPRRPLVRSQTRTKKKTTTPTFDETFTFSISPKIDDIKYTWLDVTVMDHGMLRADSVLGQIKLGYKATEEDEFDHWNQVLQIPGKVITTWHMLMDSTDS